MKLFIIALSVAAALPAWADTVYDSLPTPLPPNTPSESYEANALSEFGDQVQLAGPATLQLATVAMSDWAYESEWTASVNGTTITTAGFYLPLTLNLYSVGAGNSVGALIGSYTVNAFIPWRPEPSAACVGNPHNVNNAWLGPDGITCYNGALSTVTFDLGYLPLPGQFIYGVAYNTQHSGYSPTGVSAPYNSLNFAVTQTAPSTGSNPVPENYMAFSNEYGSPAPFGLNTSDSSYLGEADFEATPEPAALALGGIGLLCVCLARRARAR